MERRVLLSAAGSGVAALVAQAIVEAATIDVPGPATRVVDFALQADGKAVIVGTVSVPRGESDTQDDLVVLRVNLDGSLDPSFGNGGVVTRDVVGRERDDEAAAVALQPDGKIVVAGTVRPDLSAADDEAVRDSDFSVTRLNPDGSIDLTFGAGPGVVTTDFSADRFADPIYDEDSSDHAGAMAILPDGRILVAGEADGPDDTEDIAAARYLPDGRPDPSFGPDGAGRTVTSLDLFTGGEESAGAVALQPDGKFVVAGGQEFADQETGALRGVILIARYNADGSLDESFGPGGEFGFGGLVSTDVAEGVDGTYGLAIQPDGKIVAGGFAATGGALVDGFDLDMALARYHPDGSPDESFGSAGVVRTSVPDGLAAATDLLLDPAGNVIAVGVTAPNVDAAPAGRAAALVGQYRPDGTPDPQFGEGGMLRVEFERGGEPAPGDPLALDLASAARGVLTEAGVLQVVLKSGGEVRRLRVGGADLIGAPPTASVPAAPATVTELGQTELRFDVRYEDAQGIDVETLGADDVLVLAPDGTSHPAELVSVDAPADGTPRIATYRYAPTGTGFTAAANGTYRLAIAARAVRDVGGTAVAAGDIPGATFSVDLISDGPNLQAVGPLTGRLPASVLGGAKASPLTLLVRNSGTQPFAGTVDIGVVASSDGTFADADAPLGTFAQKLKLKPGAQRAVKLKVRTFPASLPDGDYFLVAKVDAGNAVRELVDEIDNTATTAAPVRIAAPFTDVGFAGPATVARALLVPGGKGRVSVPLRNAGNVPAKATLAATLFASPDPLQGGDDLPLGAVPIRARVNAGGTGTANLSFAVPAGLAPGNYFLVLVLDAAADDRNPADNVAISGSPVVVA